MSKLCLRGVPHLVQYYWEPLRCGVLTSGWRDLGRCTAHHFLKKVRPARIALACLVSSPTMSASRSVLSVPEGGGSVPESVSRSGM